MTTISQSPKLEFEPEFEQVVLRTLGLPQANLNDALLACWQVLTPEERGAAWQHVERIVQQFQEVIGQIGVAVSQPQEAA